MLLYFLYTVFALACFVLILAVLLQPGKADAGALFTSSVSSAAFGPRGTQTLLAKITIGAAATFMLLALALSLGVGGARSVMEGQPEESQQTQQQPTSPQPDAAPASAPEGAASPAGEQPAASPQQPPAADAPNTAASPAANTGASPQSSPAGR